MSRIETQPDDAARAGDGWIRRFTAFGARLNEAIELYRGLGFEVRLEPAEPGAEEAPSEAACAQCFVMSLARTIYTRPVNSAPGRPGGEEVIS